MRVTNKRKVTYWYLPVRAKAFVISLFDYLYFPIHNSLPGSNAIEVNAVLYPGQIHM